MRPGAIHLLSIGRPSASSKQKICSSNSYEISRTIEQQSVPHISCSPLIVSKGNKLCTSSTFVQIQRTIADNRSLIKRGTTTTKRDTISISMALLLKITAHVCIHDHLLGKRIIPGKEAEPLFGAGFKLRMEVMTLYISTF